jgi:Lon protease-like protein
VTTSADSAVLPIFPLTGTLLLPGNFLPLNIFEERYRNLVGDALKADRTIGMIQPWLPAADNWGLGSDEEPPELYQVGCAGRIEEYEPQDDGRYLIVLKGTCRFRVRKELELKRGYRRVVAGFDEFVTDLQDADFGVDRVLLLAAIEAFSKQHGLEFDPELLESLPALNLLHAVAAALPFAADEKQALLEAPSPEERQQTLLTLMGMGFEEAPPERSYSPPIVN